jgi:hypothetical protein
MMDHEVDRSSGKDGALRTCHFDEMLTLG